VGDEISNTVVVQQGDSVHVLETDSGSVISWFPFAGDERSTRRPAPCSDGRQCAVNSCSWLGCGNRRASILPASILVAMETLLGTTNLGASQIDVLENNR
jgi:hypothetical protein